MLKKYLPIKILFAAFLVLVIQSVTSLAYGQNEVRAYIFYNPSSQREQGLSKQLKQLLDVAAKQPGFVTGSLLQSVSGKNQMVASVLWNNLENYTHWTDAILKKQPKLSMAKFKVQQGTGILERRMGTKIIGTYVPNNAKEKSFKLNDYASLTYWTTNEELKDLFVERLTEAFDSTKKAKGFHYGELESTINDKKNIVCITMSYWNTSDNALAASKTLKIKVKNRQNLSLISNELLEKKAENKRYKVVYIKAH